MSSTKRICGGSSSLQETVNLEELNNDIPFDVLSRLPTKYMPGLKCVCKGWNRLISDPIFMKLQSQKKEPVSGFFIQQKYEWCEEDIPAITYIPVGKQEAELFRTVFDFLPEDAVVLSSCNGLVCCRSCLPGVTPFLYICNPLNRDRMRLKWDEPNREDSFALAFDPCSDLSGTSTKFKLIRVKQFETETTALSVSFDIYTSDTGAWKKSDEICKCDGNLSKNKGIYVGGILHWLTDGDELLTFNVESELSWLVSVPLPAIEFTSIPDACIGDSDGKLHYILISQYGLQVWVLDEYFESKWSLKFSKTLAEMEREHIQFLYNLCERVTQRLQLIKWVDLLAFKDGYLLMRASFKIMLYNIETNRMQLVCSLTDLGTASTLCTVLAYSLSLAPLNQD